MTTYTMNGHRHSTLQVQTEILSGMARNQAAHRARKLWRAQPQPEKFNCLDSPDPGIQLQTALKQINNLSHRQRQLIDLVLLLDQALRDAQSMIAQETPIHRADLNKLRTSDDFHDYMQQLNEQT